MTPSPMLLFTLLIQVIVRASAAALSEPPLLQNIHVDKWVVTWTPTTKDDVSYTVQYQSFDGEKWMDVPGCVNIDDLNSCNATSAQVEDEKRCPRLRVRAEIRGMKSTAVEACSNNGDDCSPEVNLTARPGALTVMLNREHRLAKDNGDAATYRVYYGREGEPLENYKDDLASVPIRGLEEGQRYCLKVQFMLYDRAIGPPSCIKCELIPNTKEAGPVGIIMAVLAVVFLLALSLVVAYVLIYHYGKIKQWLRPPCEIPSHLHNPLPQRYHPVTPSEERYDVISRVTLDD